MIRAYLSGIFAGLVALAAAMLYRKGRKDADNANDLQDATDYAETRKRMDDADVGDDAARWLSDRAKR